MKNLLKQIVKGAVITFVVGAALAYLLPYIAMVAGVAEAGATSAAYIAAAKVIYPMSSPMWVGLFFGSWGAIEPIARTCYNKIFGEDKPAPHSKTDTPTRLIIINRSRDMEPTQGQSQGTKFRDAVEAERRTVLTDKAQGI